jgi:hypothetical protein
LRDVPLTVADPDRCWTVAGVTARATAEVSARGATDARGARPRRAVTRARMGAVAPTKEHVDAIVTTTRLAIQRTRVRASVGVTRDGSMALVPASTTNTMMNRRAESLSSISKKPRRNDSSFTCTCTVDRRKILP